MKLIGERCVLLSILSLVVALLVIAVAGWQGAKDLQADIDHASEVTRPKLRQLAAMERAMTSLRIDESGLVLIPPIRGSGSSDLDSSAEQVVDAAVSLKPLLTEASQTLLFNLVTQEWAELVLVHGRVERLAHDGESAAAADVYAGAGTQYFQDLRASLRALRDADNAETKQRVESTAERVALVREIATAAVLLLILFAVGWLVLAMAAPAPRQQHANPN